MISGPALFGRYVLVEKARLATSPADPLYHRVAAGIVEICHQNPGTLTRQCQGTGRTDPRCATGYDRNFAVYLTHGVPPYFLG